MKKPLLTKAFLLKAAREFCVAESARGSAELFGVTDGKAVGTFIEHRFQSYLQERFEMDRGSSAKGIDLPGDGIETDIKVTSIRQPQSSSPFRDARQKVFGLGYKLLVFVYDKTDNPKTRTATLNFVSCCFLEKGRTADYTITYRLREMVADGANRDDIIAYLNDRNIPADDITLGHLADEIIRRPPEQGYLTISNALQWRLQYGRVVSLSQEIEGITRIISRDLS